MKAAEGTGSAHGPTVVSVNDIPALEAALASARQLMDDELPARDLANALVKVEKQKAQLAAAEAEVVRLRALVEGGD